MSIQSAAQRRLCGDMIDYVTNELDSNDWKILLVDPHSMRVISAACRMYDVMEKGISSVENVLIKRQPLPKIDAIYFLTPNEESVAALIADFADKKKPAQYNNVHLFFTSRLSDDLLKRIQKSRVRRRLKTCRELNVDFLAFESQAYQMDAASSLRKLYASAGGQEEINEIAQKLLTVCSTMGELPYIRHNSSPVASSIATALHKRLRELSPEARGQLNTRADERATLLILDRAFDPIAPLLHEFTYQAMVYDLLPITDDNVFEYTYNNDGNDVVKKVLLDEHDFLWPKLRHLHIADCINRVLEDFNRFVKTNKAVNLNRGKNKDFTSLKQMAEAMKQMPEYQEMFAKYALHIRMTGDCMDQYNGSELEKIALVEQDLATGKSPKGDKIDTKKALAKVLDILRDRSVRSTDKMRLALIYLASAPDAKPADKDKLVEAAQFDAREVQVIENMAALGASVKAKRPKRKNHKGDDEETPYQVSRYVPVLKDYLIELMQGELSEDSFSYVGDEPKAGYGQKAEGKKEAKSLKSQSRKKKEKEGESEGGKERPSGPKVIVFIAGGATFSEVRVGYEAMHMFNREVVVGGTHLVTPIKLLAEVDQWGADGAAHLKDKGHHESDHDDDKNSSSSDSD